MSKCREIGRSSAKAMDGQELLRQEKAVSDDGRGTTGSQEFADRG